MSYTPHTVLAGGLTGLPGDRPALTPRPVKEKYLNGKAGYVKYVKSTVAHRMMGFVCENPGIKAAELMHLMKNRTSYGYLECLRRDGYARVTTERKPGGMAIMRVWPTDLFLAMFPPTL